MINSQNVLSEAQVKNFFISQKSYVPFSIYSSFCIFNHPCDVMMSFSTWNSVHFWIYLSNYTSLTHHTGSIDRYKQGQYFCEIFWISWRTVAKLQALFNLATYSNYSITHYVKFSVFYIFERVNKREIKMVNINY